MRIEYNVLFESDQVQKDMFFIRVKNRDGGYLSHHYNLWELQDKNITDLIWDHMKQQFIKLREKNE